ncbi:hypothetical protein [Stutzerimonas xanthomarina]|uniref:hypothetical protein n=1 Tax=Stutzerimonas xanthomarina TaxID=271420 RepID=UPI0029B0610D|nr:hypothetical protein [Stutzerimonas xanthomarina]MDX2352794.1 hypothetical protein [Stutzerimonas xanthomarina]
MIQLQKILKSFLQDHRPARTTDRRRNTEQIDRLQEKNLLLIAEAHAAKETTENLKALIGQ